jgi:hypothetical protein
VCVIAASDILPSKRREHRRRELGADSISISLRSRYAEQKEMREHDAHVVGNDERVLWAYDGPRAAEPRWRKLAECVPGAPHDRTALQRFAFERRAYVDLERRPRRLVRVQRTKELSELRAVHGDRAAGVALAIEPQAESVERLDVDQRQLGVDHAAPGES